MIAYRAAVRQPSVIEIESFDPPAPQAGQVLIRTRASLISPGTERAFFLALPNTNATYPLYPGYSNVGTIEALGAGIDGLRAGDRVASCAPHASHVIMDAARCVPVPDGLADDEATFFNLIAIAMQGVHKAHIELGEAVAVIGVGPIGNLALQLVRLNGGLPVIAIDQEPGRLAQAEQVGADVALTTDGDLPGAVRVATGADGAAVVIEASGAPSAIPTAFQIAATRGRVVLLGSTRGDTEGVNFYRDVHRKGLTIIGAHEITRPRFETLPGWWTQRDEHKIALKLLAMGRLQVKPLINLEFSWEQFPQAYARLAGWDRSISGMLIRWQP